MKKKAMSQSSSAEPKFYGRRKGKTLRNRRLNAFEDVLPEIEIHLPSSSLSPLRGTEGDEGVSVPPTSFFPPSVKEVWMEIGFGDGKHLLHQALNNPDIGFIGCEPFINGIAALCADIKDNNVKNIRIWPDDARLLMSRINGASIGKLFLLNSDPWPKKKHAKRRFVQQETLDEIHRLLKQNALFRMSSDHPVLAAWQLEKAYFHGGFAWQAECAADWLSRPADLPETRYQQKGATQGRPTVFLDFRKV